MYRGNRKHILDWTERPDFAVDLLKLVQPVSSRLTASSQWMPRGYKRPDEARLETFGPRVLPDHPCWPDLRTWWLSCERGANTPNWDLAALCEVEQEPGLILIEAKANVPELSAAPKPFDQCKATANSERNHKRIGAAIAEARSALQRAGLDVKIDRDSHYQLSNRVAFAWKLASLGVPTVLVYLGFWGDDGIADAGAPFDSDEHWHQVFAQHASSVIPADCRERQIDCGASSMWFLVRSRKVFEPSPASA